MQCWRHTVLIHGGSSSSSVNLQNVGMSDLEVKLNEVEEEYRAGKMALLSNNAVETFWDIVLHSFIFY